jgi:hypothetical protein
MSIPIAQLVEAHVRRLLGSRGVDVLENSYGSKFSMSRLRQQSWPSYPELQAIP